jgi:hypothetical protein
MTEKLYTVSLEDLRKAFSDVFAEIKGGPGSGPQGGGGHSGSSGGSSGGSSSGHGGDSKPEGASGSTPQHDDKVSDKEAREVVNFIKEDMAGINPEREAQREYDSVRSISPTSDGEPRYAVNYTDDKGDPAKETGGRIDVVREADGLKIQW